MMELLFLDGLHTHRFKDMKVFLENRKEYFRKKGEKKAKVRLSGLRR